MRLLIGIIVTLFLSIGLAKMLRDDPGYAMLSMGGWTIETSMAFLIILLIILFSLLYILIRLLLQLWKAPGHAIAANQRRLKRKARRLFNLGSRQLAAGQWAAAEKTLLRHADSSDTPAMHYLGAAHAAHNLAEKKWRRDLHLRQAEEAPGSDTLMVHLARAEFLLADNRAEEIRPVLESLRTLHPRHPGVLRWLARTYEQLKAWEPLRKILPDLQKHKVMKAEDFSALQQLTYQSLLESAAASGSLAQLRALWHDIPVALRENDEALLVNYAATLCDCDAIDDAEALLRAAINRRWNSGLVVGYGMLGRGNATEQLAAAERWLEKHDDDPYLLLTLGRLAKRCQQNEKARDYLERSIRLMPTPDAYQELGELLQSLHELTYAGQCFHAGLRLLVGKPLEREGEALTMDSNAQQLEGPAATTPSPAPTGAA